MGKKSGQEKYRTHISAFVLSIIGGLILLYGLICLFLGIKNGNFMFGFSGLYTGLVLITISAFFFVVANIAEDLNWGNYLKSYYGQEQVNYHIQSMEKLHSIERLLTEIKQNQLSQDSSPGWNSNEQPESASSPGQVYQEPGTRRQTRYRRYDTDVTES